MFDITNKIGEAVRETIGGVALPIDQRAISEAAAAAAESLAEIGPRLFEAEAAATPLGDVVDAAPAEADSVPEIEDANGEAEPIEASIESESGSEPEAAPEATVSGDTTP
jgi:hypothetical protein